MYNYVNSDAGLYSLKAGGIFFLLNNYIPVLLIHFTNWQIAKVFYKLKQIFIMEITKA